MKSVLLTCCLILILNSAGAQLPTADWIQYPDRTGSAFTAAYAMDNASNGDVYTTGAYASTGASLGTIDLIRAPIQLHSMSMDFLSVVMTHQET